MMKKGFFDKVFSPGGTIASKDFRGTDRLQFLLVMEEEYGYNRAALQNRLFYRGFDGWMLQGIDQIKDEYAKEHPELTEWREKKEPFFELLKRCYGGCTSFWRFLRGKDMNSDKTIRRRFYHEDWKPWERIGMQKILADYCDRY